MSDLTHHLLVLRCASMLHCDLTPEQQFSPPARWQCGLCTWCSDRDRQTFGEKKLCYLQFPFEKLLTLHCICFQNQYLLPWKRKLMIKCSENQEDIRKGDDIKSAKYPGTFIM